MNKDQITVLLALGVKPKAEAKLLSEILPEKGLVQSSLSRLYDSLQRHSTDGLVLLSGVNMHSTAKWSLTPEGKKEQDKLKKQGWYLGY